VCGFGKCEREMCFFENSPAIYRWDHSMEKRESLPGLCLTSISKPIAEALRNFQENLGHTGLTARSVPPFSAAR